MPRYYCVQAFHPRRGWVDLPMLAAVMMQHAVKAARDFATDTRTTTRVIRKPHGWVPASRVEPVEQADEPPTTSEEEKDLEPLPRVSSIRKGEKLRRRHEGQARRKPTSWQRLVAEWLE